MIETNYFSKNQHVRDQDPLNLDQSFVDLPTINEAGDLSKLVQLTEDASRRALEIENPTQAASLAVLRDLGMICASIRRTGAEPTQVVTLSRPALLKHGLNSSMVPRDTVYTYGPWNPQLPRQRRFTALNEETQFIEAFTHGMSSLDECTTTLHKVQLTKPNDPSYLAFIDTATEGFEQMVQSIITVHKQVPAEIFTGRLRPFFDPYEVGHRSYLAPGGAQMPILLVDLALWGADYPEKVYQDYLQENLIYTTPFHRELAERMQRAPSILESLANFSDKETLDPTVVASVKHLLSRIIAFRAPHLAMAKDNFKLRQDSDVGSGGYQTDILEYLLSVTQGNRNQLTKTINEKQ